MEALSHASVFQMLGMLIGMVTVAMGFVFAISPSEQRLALMRPLSLAAIFTAICSMLLGLLNGLIGVSRAPRELPLDPRMLAAGLAEAVVPAFVGFTCLAVAWLLVTIGMRKPL